MCILIRQLENQLLFILLVLYSILLVAICAEMMIQHQRWHRLPADGSANRAVVQPEGHSVHVTARSQGMLMRYWRAHQSGSNTSLLGIYKQCTFLPRDPLLKSTVQ